LNISPSSPIAYVNQHASNSSATHVPLENPQFGMSLNYFRSQTASASNTFPPKPKSEMLLNPPMIGPLNSFPSSAATS
jgi:hypothetical protein